MVEVSVGRTKRRPSTGEVEPIKVVILTEQQVINQFAGTPPNIVSAPIDRSLVTHEAQQIIVRFVPGIVVRMKQERDVE
ncbi:hypothetical protein D3C84_904980 [compost metagenome]